MTPCSSDACDETSDACSCETPDADGDGEAAIGCGGADCDDEDATRFPGNAEVCDDVDQDCDVSTLAGAADGDGDDDGFVSVLCCNGDQCGEDCDDDDPAVRPDARELCNAIDDDCSGLPDDPDPGEQLCPGGLCSSGRCAFSTWDRLFVPEMGERTIATDVGYDELGNIFVAGLLAEPVDFGSGTSVENAYLISYAPNGSLRWVRSATADVLSLDIAVGAAGERVYVTGRGSAEGTSLAGVAVGSSYFLAVLDMDGTEITARRLPGIGFALPSTEGVVVVGMSESAFDFGGGTEVPLAGTRDLYIATYDRDGTSTGATTVGAAGTALTVEAAGEMGGGLHAVMFDAGGPFSWGGTPFLGDSHVLVVVDATGSLRWSREISRVRGAGLRATSLAAGDGQLLISGELYEEQDLGGGPIGPAPGDASECFVVATDLEGAFLWQRTISGFPDAGDGRCNSARLDVLPDGSVLVGGAFNDMVSVGSGGLVAAPLASYLASFDRDGGLIYDRVIGAQSINRVAAGPSGLVFLAGSASGVVDLGSGPRSTGGTQAGFLLRLGE